MRCNRSTENAISLALLSALDYLDNKNTYVRLLIIDYSSVFNTIIITKLIIKFMELGPYTIGCSTSSSTDHNLYELAATPPPQKPTAHVHLKAVCSATCSTHPAVLIVVPLEDRGDSVHQQILS